MATELHIAEHALALHPFLQHFESLVDIVIAELSRTKTCKCVTPIAVKGGPYFESAPRGHVQNGHHTCHRTATANFVGQAHSGFGSSQPVLAPVDFASNIGRMGL